MPVSLPVPSGEREPDSLELLDDPVEWAGFSRQLTQDAGVWESNVVIGGMHCAACASTVEDALRKVRGVEGATVSAASRRARVVWRQAEVLPSGWMRALERSGYSATPAQDAWSHDARKAETRKALWRWLVAVLCMMQVMMYAYPAYVALPGDLSQEMERLLRWASWLLTLPVMVFSCGPFFRNAARDIRSGQISMDLPVALGIVITFAVSTAGTFEPNGIFGKEVFFDSLTMFVAFLLTGRWLELRMRDRTAGALEALMNRLPQGVQRRKADGSFEWVNVRRITEGDVLRVEAGQSFAADGVILAGSTSVDEALLTGESSPQTRNVGQSVAAGSHNLQATVDIQVEQVGAQTRFGQIMALMESAALSKPAVALLADRIAKPFLWCVLIAAAGAAAWWWPTNPGHAIMVAVAVLIVTCPCALSLATPAAMLAAAGSLARAGVTLRHLQPLETLSKVDTVVFDKTGTLTMDTLALVKVSTRAGITREQALQVASALASHSMHPVSRAICSTAAESGLQTLQCDGVEEESGGGLSGVVRGGLDAAMAPHAVKLGSAAYCGIPAEESTGPTVHLCDDSGWIATFHWQESLRPHVHQVLEGLRSMGISIRILSGDQPRAVRLVADAVGCAAATGGCSPADKLRLLQELQSQGRTVAMVGDGLNDAPVLAAAAVSFAMGHAVPLTQTRADFVILGSGLPELLSTFRVARKTQKIVRQNLWWALAYNAACVPLAVAGLLPAWLAGLGMATSSLVVVVNALRVARPPSELRAS